MSDKLRDELYTKEITRKQFLQYMSGIFIGLFGVGSFISSLLHFGSSAKINASSANSTDDRFGTRKFGR
jgi:hypothetical protein